MVVGGGERPAAASSRRANGWDPLLFLLTVSTCPPMCVCVGECSVTMTLLIPPLAERGRWLYRSPPTNTRDVFPRFSRQQKASHTLCITPTKALWHGKQNF